MRNVNGTVQTLMSGKRCAVEGDLAHPPLPWADENRVEFFRFGLVGLL